VAERGFHAVSMADIGAASGIVGSGVYRHFDSKSAVLVALLDEGMERLLAGAAAAVGSGRPDAELPDGDARARVHVAIGAIQSAATWNAGVPREPLAELLVECARRCLYT